ncbi:MAG: poly(R)-hydroxyalkanoic acid synthase subunit PhaE [Anaerolineales bacterium]|jgi:polyhydroxyalkanoic acid synthase PhaR subunit
MSEEKKSESDPFAQMIQFYDAMSKSWAKAMSDAVTSESFAKSMAEQMESSMEVFSQMRRQMGEIMEKYLEQMNLPTRKEVVNVAERLTRLEMAIDDLDAKLNQVLDKLEDRD